MARILFKNAGLLDPRADAIDRGVAVLIDRAIEEAAQGPGAGPWRTFRHVILPLAMPGVIAGAIFSFILAMNAYATPVLLGGRRSR